MFPPILLSSVKPQRLPSLRQFRVVASLLAALVLVVVFGGWLFSQTVTTNGRGVVRLRVRVKDGDATKGLSRKRFFMVKGSLEQNRSWIQQIEQQLLTSRDCYYRAAGASEELIKWLQVNDCESVYCREVLPEEVDTVPEFRRAVESGTTEFRSRDLARKWLSVNISAELRDGFYRTNQQKLQHLLRAAESASGGQPQSVMTDRNGTAYFTDLEPGRYVLSNLLPAETATALVTWTCELEVKPGDLTNERPFLISNRKDRNVKCVAVEKPLPVCPGRLK